MKKLIALTLLLLTTQSLFAQEEKIIIIDKGSGSTKSSKSRARKDLVDNDHVLKFSVLQMFANEINIGFEKKVNETSSFEIEAGPTISNIGFSVKQNHYADWYGSSNETSKLGLFISGSYRFYPMDGGKVLNRFYVAPVIKYRRMNFGIEDSYSNLDPVDGHENHLYFTFNFGYQSWLSERFSIDYFAGIGLGHESHVRYNVTSQQDPVTYEYTYFWKKNAYSGARYLFTAGLKVGIGN